MKFKSLVAIGVLAVLPFALFAGVKSKGKGKKVAQDDVAEAIPHIDFELVKGTYVVSTFTNSDPDAGSPAEASASIYKMKIRDTGNVLIRYLLAKTSDGSGQPNTFEANDVTGNLVFDPDVNGLGEITLDNFPAGGLFPRLKVLFKTRNGKVVGFKVLTIDSDQSQPLWYLGSGWKNS